ncbi:hypothetical protein IKW75_00040 [Candidatus Saccharibacteria bacterium]|nr:hypothetical protein [Candidatus Saccharibacteria bacterium]
MNISIIFLLLAIIIVGVMVFVAISITSKRRYSFDKEEYQTAWLKIENSLVKDNKSSYATAVIEADKLLDKALSEMAVPGKTMGDRLKKAGQYFSSINSVWYAHKMRNQIAHEHGFSIEYNQAKHALASFKQALKDLEAI